MKNRPAGRQEWALSQHELDVLLKELQPFDDDVDESVLQNKNNWELTPAAFEKLMARLKEEGPNAGVEYEKYRKKLNFFFERKGCHIPEDKTDETFNRVSKKLDEGEVIRIFSSYCHVVARNVWLESLKFPEQQMEVGDARDFD